MGMPIDTYKVEGKNIIFTDKKGKETKYDLAELKRMVVFSNRSSGWKGTAFMSSILGFVLPAIWIITVFSAYMVYRRHMQMYVGLFFIKTTGSIKAKTTHVVGTSNKGAVIRNYVADIDKIIDEHQLKVEFLELELPRPLAGE